MCSLQCATRHDTTRHNKPYLIHEINHVWCEGWGVLTNNLDREHRRVVNELLEDTACRVRLGISVQSIAVLVKRRISRVITRPQKGDRGSGTRRKCRTEIRGRERGREGTRHEGNGGMNEDKEEEKGHGDGGGSRHRRRRKDLGRGGGGKMVRSAHPG